MHDIAYHEIATAIKEERQCRNCRHFVVYKSTVSSDYNEQHCGFYPSVNFECFVNLWMHCEWFERAKQEPPC